MAYILRQGFNSLRLGLQSWASGLPTASHAQRLRLTRSMSTGAEPLPVVDPKSAEGIKEQARRDAQDQLLNLIYPFHSADRNVFTTLYRYESAENLAKTTQKGSVGGYATTVKSDSAAAVHDGAQIDPKWTGSMIVRHDLPIASVNHVAPALSHGNTGANYEVFASSYPNVGKGGWPQMITGSNVNPSVTPPTPLK